MKHVVNKVLRGLVASRNTFRDTSQYGYKESIFFKHIQVLKDLMCQLYGEKDATKLHTSWVPIMAEIVDLGPILNCGCIISSSLNKSIDNSVIIDEKQESSFYMSSYIMNVVSRGQHIRSMNWEWRSSPLVHVYCLEIWKIKYKYDYETICNSFISTLCFILTCEPTPCMLQGAMDVVSKIGDWYISSSRLYIHIYGSTKSPHHLPHYDIDNIFLLEVAY